MKTSRLSVVTEIVLHNCDPVSTQMGTASWLSTLIQLFSSCTRKVNGGLERSVCYVSVDYVVWDAGSISVARIFGRHPSLAPTARAKPFNPHGASSGAQLCCWVSHPVHSAQQLVVLAGGTTGVHFR